MNVGDEHLVVALRLDGDHPRSRNASTLRLLILVVATALAVAFITAGMFVEIFYQIAQANH